MSDRLETNALDRTTARTARGWVLILLFVMLLPGHAATAAESAREPSAGNFLIASPTLHDPNFSRTVILLLRHDDDGTLGLIVNRKTELPLSELIPRNKRLKLRSDAVYNGGPVMKRALTMLMRSDSEPDETCALIFENLYLSQDPKLLDRIVGEAGPDEPIDFRVYTGYAGWAVGQLNAEIERGDWQVAPGNGDIVFDPEPGRVWQLLSPKDPSQLARGDLSFWRAALCLMGAR